MMVTLVAVDPAMIAAAAAAKTTKVIAAPLQRK
jgi:hypothetical protein